MKLKGLSYTEIAQQLQVSRASIASDVHYNRQHAKASMKEYVTEHFPDQYMQCLSALDIAIKNALEVYTTSHDNREKLQANEQFRDTHVMKCEMMCDAPVIDKALEYIRSKQQTSARISNSHGNQEQEQTVF